MNLFKTLAIMGCIIFSSPSYSATTINFDELDLSQNYGFLQNGYAGLKWSNFYTFKQFDKLEYTWADGQTYEVPVHGYKTGVVSKSNAIAANEGGVITSDSLFTLNSLYVTGGIYPSQYFRIWAMGKEEFVAVIETTIYRDKPTYLELNWEGVDFLWFQVAEGTFDDPKYFWNFGDGRLNPIIIDDLRVTLVPEPSTYTMLTMGIVLVGAAFRRRQKNTQRI